MALVILSTGIVTVYQIFIASLNYQRHAANRLYALHLLNDKVEKVQLGFEAEKIPLPADSRKDAASSFGVPVSFTSAVGTENVAELDNVVRADINVFWKEDGRGIKQSRSVYLYHPLEKEYGAEEMLPGQ